jgi:hypothetical protein
MVEIILLEVAAAIEEHSRKVERPRALFRPTFRHSSAADLSAMTRPRPIAGLPIGALLAGAAACASAAAPATADEALARQRDSLRASLALDCGRARGDIVVCGRQGPDPNRLPLPVEPEPGARHSGEPPAPSEALAFGAEKCTTVGPNQQCSGGLPIIPIAIWLVQTAVKAAKGDD